MKELRGKVAVITGGASGIGYAMAECFGRQGMKVVVADIEKTSLDEAVRNLQSSGIEAIGVATDVSDWKSVKSLADATFEHFGTAHLICNNAGVGPGDITWNVPLNMWKWILDVNLMGVVHGILAFVPRLVEQGEGHVVNTASEAGFMGLPGMGPYNASKHAVVAVSKTLQQDLDLTGSAVKVTVLCPAMTKTRMNDSGRNWIDRYGAPPESGLGPGHPQHRDWYRTRMEKEGMDPRDVAEKVLEAVREEKFFVAMNPNFREAYLNHLDRFFGLSGN